MASSRTVDVEGDPGRLSNRRSRPAILTTGWFSPNLPAGYHREGLDENVR
jgi:hypothetical protein